MTRPRARRDDRRWRPRPLVSFALRFASVLVPAAAGFAAAYAFVAAVPVWPDAAVVAWILSLALLSTIAAALAERIGKRFLPLAMLFRLSLVFPDRAPRLGRAGRPRKRLRARGATPPPSPSSAASS